jgi:hypothetical protein
VQYLTIRIPLTWPFAIIPVIPNFPMFYVIWRAWSHYKAWRGAVYLEQLLQSGLIVEKSDARLDDVYAARGQTIGPKGAEDHAPDETHGKTAAPASTSVRSSAKEAVRGGFAQAEAPADERRTTEEAKSLPDQAKGQEGSVDGTATPESMIYKGKAGAAEETGSGDRKTQKKHPRLHHPSLLIAPSQVPILVRTFNLRQAEEIDVNRAVEQAELRLKKADEKAATGSKA